MSEKLTTFERALLAQFETLEVACGTALDGSEKTSEALRDFSSNMRVRLDQIERRQSDLERTQTKLIAALNEQTRHTEVLVKHSDGLVQQVNALLAEGKK